MDNRGFGKTDAGIPFQLHIDEQTPVYGMVVGNYQLTAMGRIIGSWAITHLATVGAHEFSFERSGPDTEQPFGDLPGGQIDKGIEVGIGVWTGAEPVLERSPSGAELGHATLPFLLPTSVFSKLVEGHRVWWNGTKFHLQEL